MAADPPPPAAQASYSYAQLEGLWINAGGPAAVAPVAAAIAEAESGGNPLAAYPSTTVAPGAGSNTDATGLWQILGVPAGFTPAQLTDPAANAQMAVAKYQQAGNSFTPWETYTNGAYTAFLSSGTTPDTAGLPSAAPSTTASAVLTSANSATCALSVPVAGCLLPKSALRGIIGGAVLTAAGILGLASLVILAASAFEHSGAATAVTQAAGKVAPVGRVVQAVTPAARQERQLSRRESAVGGKERVTRLERREKRAAT